MISWINRRIAFMAWMFHFFIVSWRLDAGEKNILHDRPLWFVKDLATSDLTAVMGDEAPALRAEARAEVRRRSTTEGINSGC